MNKFWFFCAAVAATVVTPSNAADVALDPIIITATRTAQTADQTLAAVTVVTREDIDRTQAKTVAELMSGLAGVQFSELGGYGKTSEVYLRGTNKEHVVVLVDGVRIGSATLGDAAWQHIPLGEIDRIEVVRGPQSSLYGADAIGGVIQIFTRKGSQGFRAGVSAGRGTHDTREYAANLSGANGDFNYSATASRFQSDGINSRTLTTVANDPDNDGYDNDAFSTRVGYRFGKRSEIRAHMMHARGYSYFDTSGTTATSTNEVGFEQNVQGAELRLSPTSMWDMKLQAGRSQDDTDNFRFGTIVNTINTLRRTQSWQNDVALAERQLFTLGIDHQTDLVKNINSTGVNQFAVSSRNNTGYFLQHQAGFDKNDIVIGARRDDNQSFGVNDTGNVMWGYALDDDRLRLIASYGTAFRAPTFNQLYATPTFGNPDIKPEESESAEIALKGKSKTGKWDVRAYQTNVDNLIVNVGSPLRPQNIAKARIRGLETETSKQFENTEVALSLTLLDARGVDSDKLLPRRSKRSARLEANHKLGIFSVGGEWIVRSYSYDDVNNSVRLGGYGLINLHARVDVLKNWFLKFRVGNALDKEYETADTYNSLGRNYFLTLGYQTN